MKSPFGRSSGDTVSPFPFLILQASIMPALKIVASSCFTGYSAEQRGAVMAAPFVRLTLKNTRATLEIVLRWKIKESSPRALRATRELLAVRAFLQMRPISQFRASRIIASDAFEPGLRLGSFAHRAAGICRFGIVSSLFSALAPQTIERRKRLHQNVFSLVSRHPLFSSRGADRGAEGQRRQHH